MHVCNSTCDLELRSRRSALFLSALLQCTARVGVAFAEWIHPTASAWRWRLTPRAAMGHNNVAMVALHSRSIDEARESVSLQLQYIIGRDMNAIR